jgi:hypothetical protein
MCDRDAALRHQVAHVAITQLISDIPSHGLNDQEMIEMAAFEEFRLLKKEVGSCQGLSIIIRFAPEPAWLVSALAPRQSAPEITAPGA